MFTDSRSIIRTVSEREQIFLFGGVLFVFVFCFVGLGLVGGFLLQGICCWGGALFFFN